jgi:hypothetical protein
VVAVIYASLVAGRGERIDARGTLTADREGDRVIAAVSFELACSRGSYVRVQHTSVAPLVRALVCAAGDLCRAAEAPQVAALDADAGVCDAVRMLLADAASVLEERSGQPEVES